MILAVIHHHLVHVATHTPFLPQTLGAWAAIAAALLSGGAAALSGRNHRRIGEVRVLVNGNLQSIKDELEDAKAERDRVRLELAAKERDPTP